MTRPRDIPSIDRLLQRAGVQALVAEHGRAAVTEALRRSADGYRDLVIETADAADGDPAAFIEADTRRRLDARGTPSLVDVINATGVILHTNLGRAPLARQAADAAAAIASGYSNLEYDLAAGTRGHRHVHAERLLTGLTGAEAALVVNNNAAAALVVLAALAAGREAIVSRGELVEIGGGFRVPDVMAQSGAILREVGTTNRTRVSDYAAAIGERTALILRVHPSNFHMDGFTERAPLKALADLAHRFEVPLVEDLGSGWLGDANAPAVLRDEPTIGASLTAGVDLVTFSGDKLLGGPQSGIVAGRRALVDRVRSHPLMRALRADKITYAALETTLALWAREPLRKEIPIYRMLTTSVDEIDRRAHALAARLKDMADVQVIDGDSTVGGGSAPQSAIPTRLLAVHVEGRSAADLDRRLRAHHPPVVARIQDDRVMLDLRTVAPDDDQTLFSAVEGLKASG